MTSQFATNAVLPSLAVEHYLVVDANGYPLQGQVAKKTQLYSGAGGTLILDGSDFVLITGAMAGDLTIDLTAATALHNLVGRTITIATTAEHVGEVILDATGHTLADSGGVVGASAATIATTIATSFQLSFMDPDTIAIQHGAGVTVTAVAPFAGLVMQNRVREPSPVNLTSSMSRRQKTPSRQSEF